MVLSRRLKVLCAAAVGVGVYILVTRPDSAESLVPAAAGNSGNSRVAAASAPVNRDRASALTRLAHRVTEGKAVDALFHPQSWYVAPPPPPPAPVVYVPSPPPSAPPIPFTVMGSYAHPGEATVYFLTRGDRVFDVHIGDTIDNTYSVDGAANGQLRLTYKPLNIQQTLPLGDSQ
jgi:hypothetical protein